MFGDSLILNADPFFLFLSFNTYILYMYYCFLKKNNNNNNIFLSVADNEHKWKDMHRFSEKELA